MLEFPGHSFKYEQFTTLGGVQLAPRVTYARKDVPRTAGGWTVTANAVENAAEVAMPTCTGGSATATHFGIGTDASGAGKLLYKGALGQPLAISNLIEPKFPAGTIDVTED